MTSDWVATICTAAVGTAGIAGTFWTARQGRLAASDLAETQRKHSEREWARGEMRDAYIGFLDAVHGCRYALAQMSRLEADATDERQQLADAAIANLASRREPLRLAGSDATRTLARETFSHFSEVLSQEIYGIDADPDHELTAALVASMKTDLGFDLSSDDEEWMAQYLAADSVRTEEDGL